MIKISRSVYSQIRNLIGACQSFSWNTPKGDDAILIRATNPHFSTFVCINFPAILICRYCWINFTLYNNYLWNFCVKYQNFESEICRNYEMLWIFQVSFRKFWGNFMESSHKIYKKIRFIEKILRKYVRKLDKFSYNLLHFQPLKYLYKSFASITRKKLQKFLQGYLETFWKFQKNLYKKIHYIF